MCLSNSITPQSIALKRWSSPQKTRQVFESAMKKMFGLGFRFLWATSWVRYSRNYYSRILDQNWNLYAWFISWCFTQICTFLQMELGHELFITWNTNVSIFLILCFKSGILGSDNIEFSILHFFFAAFIVDVYEYVVLHFARCLWAIAGMFSSLCDTNYLFSLLTYITAIRFSSRFMWAFNPVVLRYFYTEPFYNTLASHCPLWLSLFCIWRYCSEKKPIQLDCFWKVINWQSGESLIPSIRNTFLNAFLASIVA